MIPYNYQLWNVPVNDNAQLIDAASVNWAKLNAVTQTFTGAAVWNGTITAAGFIGPVTGTASGNLPSTGGTLSGALTGTSATFPNGIAAPITTGKPAIFLFGDSITQGTGATTFQTPGVNGQPVQYPGLQGFYSAGTSGNGPTAYAYKLLADFGNNGMNYGRGGDQAADMSFRIVQMTRPTVANNPVTTMMISTNDANVYGTNTNQQDTFTKALLFSAAWTAIPDQGKVLANSSKCSNTGVWTADPTTIPVPFGTVPGALSTTTGGATITCTITTYASTLYIFYQKADGWAGTATVTIDGVPATGSDATLFFFGLNGSSILTANGSTGALALARYTGLSVGVHTVTITGTSAGGTTLKVLGMASPYPPAAGTVNPPAVYVGGTPWNQNDSPEPATSQYNTIITNSVATLAGDGLNVTFVNVRSCTNSTTDYTGLTDTNGIVWAGSWNLPYHPGDIGHYHLYRCFANAIKMAVTQPSQSIGIYGGSYGAIDGTLSNLPTNGGDTTQTPTVLSVRNWSPSISLSAVDIQAQGGNLVTLGQWGAGNGAGLAGVTGMFDTTKSWMIWNATTNGDFCSLTATSYGSPNVNICAGSTLYVQGGNTGNAYRVGMNTNVPGTYNSKIAAGAEAIIQLDGQTQAVNPALVLQSNNASANPYIKLVNKQAPTGSRDWSFVHRTTPNQFALVKCSDDETTCSNAMTIDDVGLVPDFPAGLSATGIAPIAGTDCLQISSSGIITNTGAACGTGTGASFPAITGGTNTTAHMTVGTGAILDKSGTGSIVANTQRGNDAVLDWGFDKSGTVNTTNVTAMTNYLAAVTTSGSPELWFPCGTYYFSSTVQITTARHIKFVGEGNASNGKDVGCVTFATDQNSSIFWFNNTSAPLAGVFMQNIQFYDSSVSHNQITAAVRFTDQEMVTLINVNGWDIQGQHYNSTADTVAVTLGSTTVNFTTASANTNCGGVNTSSATHYPCFLVVNDTGGTGKPYIYEIASCVSTTQCTLALQYQGVTQAAAAYSLDYGGQLFWFDPGTTSGNANQYMDIYTTRTQSVWMPYYFASGASGAIVNSRINIWGGWNNMAGVGQDSAFSYCGHFCDTIKWDGVAANGYAFGITIADGHQNTVLGARFENTSAPSVPVYGTCTASGFPCTHGVLVMSDNASDTYGNQIASSYFRQTGNAVEFYGISGQTPTQSRLAINTFRTNTTNCVGVFSVATNTFGECDGDSNFKTMTINGVNTQSQRTSCGTGTTCTVNSLSAPLKDAYGAVVLTGGTATVTGIPAFTSTSTAQCSCEDTTSPLNACSATLASTTSVTLTGNAADTNKWHCFGN